MVVLHIKDDCHGYHMHEAYCKLNDKSYSYKDLRATYFCCNSINTYFGMLLHINHYCYMYLFGFLLYNIISLCMFKTKLSEEVIMAVHT